MLISFSKDFKKTFISNEQTFNFGTLRDFNEDGLTQAIFQDRRTAFKGVDLFCFGSIRFSFQVSRDVINLI